MIDLPKTKEEARTYRYGQWAGSVGRKYKEDYCAWEIWPDSGWIPYQCTRKNGHGINNLYCKQHSKGIK